MAEGLSGFSDHFSANQGGLRVIKKTFSGMTISSTAMAAQDAAEVTVPSIQTVTTPGIVNLLAPLRTAPWSW